MEKSSEIKLNIGQVNSALTNLKASESAMNEVYQNLIKAHEALIEKWGGKSKNAFMLCSKNIESNLKGRIDTLHIQIGKLEETKEAFIEEDNALFSQD